MKDKPKFEKGKVDFKINPHLKDLPQHLKDPKNYFKIRRLLLDILGGKHSHSEVKQWSKCVQCMDKVHNLDKARKKLGFKTPHQYYAWQKVMDFIYSDPNKREDMLKYSR